MSRNSRGPLSLAINYFRAHAASVMVSRRWLHKALACVLWVSTLTLFAMDPGPTIATLIPALFLVDVASAFGHLARDVLDSNTGAPQHNFRFHHVFPSDIVINDVIIGSDRAPAVAALFIYVLALGLPTQSVGFRLIRAVLCQSSTIICSGEATHIWCHRRSCGLAIPRVIGWLQDRGVLLHPCVHARHHSGTCGDFGIINNWSARLLNPLIVHTPVRQLGAAMFPKQADIPESWRAQHTANRVKRTTAQHTVRF